MLAIPPHPSLQRALLLSLAAHLVLLSLLVTQLPEAGSPPAAGTMRALLTGQNDHQNATPALPAAKSVVATAASGHKFRPSTQHPATHSAPAKPSVATSNTESASQTAGEVAITSGLTATQTSAGSVAQSSETGNTATSAEGLRAYRLALGREARRLKLEYDRKYSQIERDLQKGWEGRVEMNVRADRSGTSVLLTRSSGYATLDEQALDLIGRAIRQTALPDSLRGQHFLLPVALEFEISKE